MQQNLTRREALKRGAMTAGALAWATPVMQVVGISPAYAAETSPGAEDCCIDDQGNTIKLARLEMKYLGADNFCDASNYTQDDSLVSCTDYLSPPDSLPTSVYIVASHQEFPFKTDGTFKPSARIWYPPSGSSGNVMQGDKFWIDAGNALETRLKGETWVHIFSAPAPYLEANYVQKVAFHTSCSEPLFTGDVFGAVELVGCEPEDPNATLREQEPETQELEGTQESTENEGTEETGQGTEPGPPETTPSTVPDPGPPDGQGSSESGDPEEETSG